MLFTYSELIYGGIKMTELQLNYEQACKCIPAEITMNDKKYETLITNSIQGSLSTAETPEYQAQFRDSPDNIETQVDMYVALLDDVCDRLSRGVQRLEPDKTRAQEINSTLENVLRTSYATIALSEVVSLADGTPLFMGYLQERLGDEKPTTEAIENAVGDYMSKLKVREILDAQGFTSKLLANLEAVLL